MCISEILRTVPGNNKHYVLDIHFSDEMGIKGNILMNFLMKMVNASYSTNLKNISNLPNSILLMKVCIFFPKGDNPKRKAHLFGKCRPWPGYFLGRILDWEQAISCPGKQPALQVSSSTASTQSWRPGASRCLNPLSQVWIAMELSHFPYQHNILTSHFDLSRNYRTTMPHPAVQVSLKTTA